MRLYVDPDACPVKEEVLRVAVRHGLPVVLIGNRWMRGLDHPLVEQVVAAEGLKKPMTASSSGSRKATSSSPPMCRWPPAAYTRARAASIRAAALRRRFHRHGVGDARSDDRSARQRHGFRRAGGYGKRGRSRFLDGLERLIQAMIAGRAWK